LGLRNWGARLECTGVCSHVRQGVRVVGEQNTLHNNSRACFASAVSLCLSCVAVLQMKRVVTESGGNIITEVYVSVTT
jgi:hypothetical protein